MPFFSSPAELKIPWEMLRTTIGGSSAIDLKSPHLRSVPEAVQFLKTYGLDVSEADDRAALLHVKTSAIKYLTEELLPHGELRSVPQETLDLDIPGLLVAASARPAPAWPNWP